MTEMARLEFKRPRGEYRKAIDAHKADMKDLVEQGKTITDIAHIYGYDRSTIRAALKRWGISPNGRYGNTQEKYALILTLYLEGKSVKEIEGLVGVKNSTVYRALNASGYDKRYKPLEEDRTKIEELIEQGKNLTEIAETTGRDHTSLRRALKRWGIELGEANRHQRGPTLEDREQVMIDSLAKKTFWRIEYLGGYVNCDSTVRLRCVECSGEFQYTADFIKRSDTFIECPYCRQKAKDRSDRLKRRVEARRREADRQLREYRKAIADEAKRVEFEKKRLEREKMIAAGSICDKCGARVPYARRVCDDCKREARRGIDKAREIRRRRRKEINGPVDKNITLKRLSKRDGCICYLCGEPVDWGDYRIDKGQKQCGNAYPSIDHVIPLAHGGTHTWDNVKLAHRICNSLKSDDM